MVPKIDETENRNQRLSSARASIAVPVERGEEEKACAPLDEGKEENGWSEGL